MSRGSTVLLGLCGAIAGAYVGAPYLDDGAICTGERALECQLNQAYLPFLSAVTIGMVAAIALWLMLRSVLRHGLRGAPERRQTTRAAVEVGDPFLELAAWGAAPRGPRYPAPQADGEVARRRGSPATGAGLVRSEPGADERAPAVSSQPIRIGARGRPVPRPRRAA